ncbi:hypothetical protein D3C78_1912880 [compost metagenome]
MPLSASLAMRIISGLLAAIFAAISRAASRSSSFGTTRSMKPYWAASRAPILSPVKNR